VGVLRQRKGRRTAQRVSCWRKRTIFDTQIEAVTQLILGMRVASTGPSVNYRCPTAESIQRSGIERARNVGKAQVGGSATFSGAACRSRPESSKWEHHPSHSPSLRAVVVTVLAVWSGIVRTDRQKANQEFN
jgi:hypothetical protein